MADSNESMDNGEDFDSGSGIGAHNLGDPDYSDVIVPTPKPVFDMTGLVAPSTSEYQYKGAGFKHKLPTGIAPFDVALGGGIPLGGAIIEIFGEESAGKTTLTYRICKRATDTGGYITWIDNESSYDDGWAMVQGVDVTRVIPYRPPYMEKAIEIILGDIRGYKDKFLPWLNNPKWKPSHAQAESAGVGVSKVNEIKEHMKDIAPSHIIAWDTLAQCPLKTVVEGEEFGGGMALRARMIKSFLSRYQVAVEGCEKLAMILLNQMIDNIGDPHNPLMTPGGRGLRHAKHLAIYVKKAGRGNQDAQQVQDTDYVMLAITKNKVTPVIASFPVIFSKAKGFMGSTSTLEYIYLLTLPWFTTSGSWKKLKMPLFEDGEMTGEFEEIGIQRGLYYDLIKKRPEIEEFIVQSIKDTFVEKFPFNDVLRDMDINSILQAARQESSHLPSESEILEMAKRDKVKKIEI